LLFLDKIAIKGYPKYIFLKRITMIKIRNKDARGLTKTSWLTSLHTFSFGDYFAPNQMGFKHLRVINEDVVMPQMGFGEHAHKNMEIISIVIAGTLAHQDSMGNGSTISPGEIQCMSAGSGILHSEFNYSTTENVHFLQIWITPKMQGLTPQYQQITIPQTHNQWTLIACSENIPDIIHINQDVRLYIANLNAKNTLHYAFKKRGSGWLQMIKGAITLNNRELTAGDGAAITEEDIRLEATTNAEFLLFDMPIN
jgi:quercetin 2,3-dioxygenase